MCLGFLQALGVSNVCNNREKEAFGSGGWHPYFGKRLWDSRSVAMLVGSLFPATAGVAANELMGELKAQYGTAMALLEQAAQDAVGTMSQCVCLYDNVCKGFATVQIAAWVAVRPSLGGGRQPRKWAGAPSKCPLCIVWHF